MWWIVHVAVLLFVVAGTIRMLRSPYEGSERERRRSIQLLILIASWVLLSIAFEYQGGSALSGAIERGRFILRMRGNPATGQEVSSIHWVTSLFVESVVFGLSPLLMILLTRSIHGVILTEKFTRAAIAFGWIWALGMGLNAALGIARWLEAAGS